MNISLYNREGKVTFDCAERELGNAYNDASIENIWKDLYALEYLGRLVE